MRFDNFLSYGEGNVINFQQGRVVQLVGANGAGKSSLATALEECLFNKNSKGLSKSELFNWEQDKKHYHIEVDFFKDGNEYTVIKDVKSTAKVTLLENGEDISGHTATQTYKVISDVFGCDFATFTKIVYQSVSSSLDFLKVTDAKRKEFLVALFDQEIYKDLEGKVKTRIKELDLTVSKLTGSVSSTKKMLDMVIKESQIVVPARVEIPEYDDTQDVERVSELKAQANLANHQQAMIKKKIEADRRVLDATKKFDEAGKLVEGVDKPEDSELTSAKSELSEVQHKLKDAESRIKTFSAKVESNVCKTCGTHLDVSDSIRAFEIAVQDRLAVVHVVTDLSNQVSDMTHNKALWDAYDRAKKTLEREDAALLELGDIDETAPTDISEIQAEVIRLQGTIQDSKKRVEEARVANTAADKQQALKDNATSKLEVLTKELDTLSVDLEAAQADIADLQIIAKSLKDIVGYKLEYNVKVFEELINKYLSDLTDGVFALTFELNATKLDVVIYNNGRLTSMASCSTGQQQRIQTATLLAIRSLLSAISKVDINLLFLDEVISYIDTQGIETLIEILLKEPELNSFIVSHGHSHPMAEQVTIVQDENQVSRLVEQK